MSVEYDIGRPHFNSKRWIVRRYVKTNGDYGHWEFFCGVGHPHENPKTPGWFPIVVDPRAVSVPEFDTKAKAKAALMAALLTK